MILSINLYIEVTDKIDCHQTNYKKNTGKYPVLTHLKKRWIKEQGVASQSIISERITKNEQGNYPAHHIFLCKLSNQFPHLLAMDRNSFLARYGSWIVKSEISPH